MFAGIVSSLAICSANPVWREVFDQTSQVRKLSDPVTFPRFILSSLSPASLANIREAHALDWDIYLFQEIEKRRDLMASHVDQILRELNLHRFCVDTNPSEAVIRDVVLFTPSSVYERGAFSRNRNTAEKVIYIRRDLVALNANLEVQLTRREMTRELALTVYHELFHFIQFLTDHRNFRGLGEDEVDRHEFFDLEAEWFAHGLYRKLYEPGYRPPQPLNMELALGMA